MKLFKKIWLFAWLFCLISTTFFNLSFSQDQKTLQKYFTTQKINDLKSLLIKIDFSNLPDDNIQKFIWINQPFFNKNYEPYDLVPLKWRSHISAQDRHTLRLEAAENIEKMANAFYSEFWKNLVIVSAYRSYIYQKNSISKKCKQSGRCAKEWESEHQLWLAVDLRETTNEQKFLSKYQKYYNRLRNNAHLYWFHQSFQNWKEIDWYYTEPRHRRYLGIDLATELYEKNMTFTQYVRLLKNHIEKLYLIIHYSI